MFPSSIFPITKRAEHCIWNSSSSNCWICDDFHLLSLSRKDRTSPKRMKVSEFLPCKEVDVSLKVIITIFTHDKRLKLFWYNLFKSYQLSETKCQIFSRVMVAVFAPFSYPFFDIVSLVKYTEQKLQLNAFLTNEKDLGRFVNLKNLYLLKNKHEDHLNRPMKDIEVPLERQSKKLQARFIKFFDSFIHYKNEQTMVACTDNSMQLMFQLSLSYHELLFTDPRNLRKPLNSF